MFTRLILFLVLLLTSSCTYQGIEEPTKTAKPSAPSTWAAAGKGNHQKISTGWVREFKDPRMSALIREALENNQNIRAAAHRLRAAKTGTITGRAARLPSITSSSSYSRSGGEQISGSENYSLSLNARWEPDLWKRLRDLEYANRADYASTLANYRAARLSLAANTAQAWCNLITANQQYELSQTTLKSFKQALPVIERRYKANTLRAVDVQFGRNNVASAERNVRSRKLDRNEAARSLELLLGRYPSASLISRNELPPLPKLARAGLPSGLLARRPDLHAARANLFASAKRADAARKTLLPNFTLSTSLNNSGTIREFLDPNRIIWTAAASIAQSVYQGGAPTAAARAAYQNNQASYDDYALLVLRAFREVESALDADRSLAQQQIFLEQEVKQTTLAENRALSDITLGIDGASFLEYLEAQRRAENARAGLIALKNQRLQNRIDLHLALGGDFFTPSAK